MGISHKGLTRRRKSFSELLTNSHNFDILIVELVTGIDEEELSPICPPTGSIFIAFKPYACLDMPFLFCYDIPPI